MNWHTTIHELETAGVLHPGPASALRKEGFHTLGDLASARTSGADLTEITGIGAITVKVIDDLTEKVAAEEAERENREEPAPVASPEPPAALPPFRWNRDQILRILGLDRQWGNVLPRKAPPHGRNVHGYLLGLVHGGEEEELAERLGFRDVWSARVEVEVAVEKLFENFALVKARPIAMQVPRR